MECVSLNSLLIITSIITAVSLSSLTILLIHLLLFLDFIWNFILLLHLSVNLQSLSLFILRIVIGQTMDKLAVSLNYFISKILKG